MILGGRVRKDITKGKGAGVRQAINQTQTEPLFATVYTQVI